MDINLDYLLDETYKALTATSAFEGYSPAVIVSKGPREVNSSSKTYALQIVPSSVSEVPETNDGSYERTFNFDVVGILLTNETELLDGSAERKSLQQFTEDTFAVLNNIRELEQSKFIAKIDFTRADYDFSFWPNVVFTISVSAKYEHKYQ